MATTEERMMIMGLCLQGILANPMLTGFTDDAPAGDVALSAQMEANVRLAHRYADKLCPPAGGASEVSEIVRLTRVAHAVLVEVEEAKPNDDDREVVFQTVSIFSRTPDVTPLTRADRIIKAIVETSRQAAEPPEPELFTNVPPMGG